MTILWSGSEIAILLIAEGLGGEDSGGGPRGVDGGDEGDADGD